AKLPILKLGEYEMWVIRIKQYFQVQDYALWEVIENDFKEERKRIDRDAKIAKQFQEAIAEHDSAHDIDWNDPAVLRYHALQNRSFSIVEVRKNMCMYLKNQGGYKQSHFKRMSYKDIRLIFERVWDQIHAFVSMNSKIEKEVMKKSGFDLQEKQFAKEVSKKKDESSSKPVGGSRKKTVAKKRIGAKLDEESAKIQKLKDKISYCELGIIVAGKDGSKRHGGHDLLLWGDLRLIFDPDENDELWMNQLNWKLLRWKLYENYGVHTLFMDGALMEINMYVEKKCPLIKELLEKMLNL
nr:hypothetical protein [Tanacetum cinerariifolium]